MNGSIGGLGVQTNCGIGDLGIGGSGDQGIISYQIYEIENFKLEGWLFFFWSFSRNILDVITLKRFYTKQFCEFPTSQVVYIDH